VTKQLWLFDLEMNSRTAITTASAFTNAALQWRPDGKALVFQQAQLGSSGNKPGVIAWDSVQNTFKTITSDGALPAWLP
jgi:Tol biopolymer transport system component